MDFEVEGRPTVSDQYELDSATYVIEREKNEVDGEQIDIYRIKSEGNILEVKKEVESEIEESTQAYEQLSEYIMDRNSQEASDSWGETESRLEEPMLGGVQ
jgi:hypothetical protein